MATPLKWLAGIAASIITGVGVWWLTHPGGPLNPQARPKAPDNPTREASLGATSAPLTVVTRISGRVLNKDNNQPLANIDVGYFRLTRDPSEYEHSVRAHLAVTAPNGSFEADCSLIEPENFPLRITLQHSSWGNLIDEENEYVRRGETKSGINLYVSDSLYKKLAR